MGGLIIISQKFFSVHSLFLAYSLTLSYVKSHPVDLKNPSTLLFPVFYSGIIGVLFFLALLASTTVILTLMVIAMLHPCSGNSGFLLGSPVQCSIDDK